MSALIPPPQGMQLEKESQFAQQHRLHILPTTIRRPATNIKNLTLWAAVELRQTTSPSTILDTSSPRKTQILEATAASCSKTTQTIRRERLAYQGSLFSNVTNINLACSSLSIGDVLTSKVTWPQKSQGSISLRDGHQS